ncbi:hypothetical protein JR316_0005622 [Psilocybe cubensis]|uniref:Uncharacterized protein n=2 Tax=Psilocybe cubensis TaxID=181762 RepID=A0ACB8H093_PSICU|nr:hypothetical protein JR316_0005622 [Psilocybe cubensis]KAH9481102.1 hypothetical protein JR316_0005622 [Psilocybe cubensis]
MSSERPAVVSDDAIREETRMDQALVPPSPPSKEGDPFSSHEGSPRRPAAQINTSAPQNPAHLSANVSASRSIEEKQGDENSFNSFQNHPNRGNNFNQGIGGGLPLPPLNTRQYEATQGVRRTRTMDTRISLNDNGNQRKSAIDWIVPSVETKPITLGQRLQPTIDVAVRERDKYAAKAQWTGYALNVAIGLQVLLGSLTTGLSAVATSGSGRSAAVSTTILGALATMVASYLARARGSNEPELSITRVKDLEQFIRECESFKMDHGDTTGHEHDQELEEKRRRFEELLGNANGERKLSPPV